MESKIITIGGDGVNYVEVRNDKPLVFIGGPCAIESEKHTMLMAEKISEICSDLCINWIFKSCYDKDCRSAPESFHGTGLEKGLKILSQVGIILFWIIHLTTPPKVFQQWIIFCSVSLKTMHQ